MSRRQNENWVIGAVGLAAGVGTWLLVRRVFSAPAPLRLSLLDTPPIPDDWARWNGARPEILGWPKRTILAVPGIERWTRNDREALLEAAETLQVPVDALATVMRSESEAKPWNAFGLKKDKDARPIKDAEGRLVLSPDNAKRMAEGKKPFFAVGLIQLTRGANLPGFNTNEQLLAVLNWSPERQIREIVIPLYQRQKVANNNPGQLYMQNFLPKFADRPADFVIGVEDAPDELGRYYAMNGGFDRNKDGKITVGEVWATAAAAAKSAGGKRITVDGQILIPNAPATSSPAVAPASSSPSTAPTAAPSTAPAAERPEDRSWRDLVEEPAPAAAPSPAAKRPEDRSWRDLVEEPAPAAAPSPAAKRPEDRSWRDLVEEKP